MSSTRTEPNRLAAFVNGLFPLFGIAGVLLALTIVGGKAMLGYEVQQEARDVRQRIDDLKRENEALSQQLQYFRSDQYAEKVAREELGLIKPSEVAIIAIPPDDRRPASNSLLPTPVPAPARVHSNWPIWQRWLALFTDPK